MKKKSLCSRRITILPAVENKHAVDDITAGSYNRLDMIKAPSGIPFFIGCKVTIHSPGITLILRNPLFDITSAPAIHVPTFEVSLTGDYIGTDNTVGTMDEMAAIPIMI
jgi:hypothetical protein